MGSKRTSDSSRANSNVTPDQMTLAVRQAESLSSMTGVSVADLTETLKWVIDPKLRLFRRICGQVVKTDPITGANHPVHLPPCTSKTPIVASSVSSQSKGRGAGCSH